MRTRVAGFSCRFRHRARGTLLRTGVLLLLAIGPLAGCANRRGGELELPRNQSDRLRAHYPDLASGRFAVLADFEEPRQLELFARRGSAADAGSMTASATGVAATGGHGLQATFNATGDRLVANNDSARQWLLKRDWRPYTLLLMNVHAPTDGIVLGFELVGGAADRVAKTQSRWVLRQGWNPLRMDISDAGQFVPLDEIRALRWSILEGEFPTTLTIDDVLLADNRAFIHGASRQSGGDLYVQREGRRINIGAAGRFELGFAHGQVVRWFDLENDPTRGRDLLGVGNTLGPMPVRLPETGDWQTDSAWGWPLPRAGAGATLLTRQRVVEANALRVVIECVWQDQPAAENANTLARWLYVIYPSGQIYVTLVRAADTPGLPADRTGLAVSRRPLTGMAVETQESGVMGQMPELDGRSAACLATDGATGDLLFMLHDAARGPRMRAVRATDTPRISVVAHGADGFVPTEPVHGLLSVWPIGICQEERLAAIARTYGGFTGIEVVVGDSDGLSAGDEAGDGFNERFGAYMLRPEAGRVELRLRGRRQPLMSPVFAVRADPDQEAWVYRDHVIHRPVLRDGRGNVLFQIPGLIESDTVVEVYLRNRAEAGTEPVAARVDTPS